MLADNAKLHRLLAPGVEAQGCELLGVELSRGHRHSVLRLYIDRAEGITLEDCERVSHQVSGLLDLEDPIAGEYSLEVSSPGEDRPLFERAHFERFVGHRVRVRMSVAQGERRNFTGELVSVTEDDAVRLRDGDDEWLLPLADMASARLVPDARGVPGSGKTGREGADREGADREGAKGEGVAGSAKAAGSGNRVGGRT